MRQDYYEKVKAEHDASMRLAMRELKIARDTFGEDYALAVLQVAHQSGLITSDFDVCLLKKYITDPKYHSDKTTIQKATGI
jgi:hypothetical protein